MDNLDWSDLARVRDSINATSYPRGQAPSIVPRLAGSVGYAVTVACVARTVNTLLFQFVAASVAMYFVSAGASRLGSALAPDGRACSRLLQGLDAPLRGLLRAVVELQAERNREFPIQQNALLALTLILLPTLQLGPDASPVRSAIWACAFAASFYAVKAWDERRNRTQPWRLAARALAACGPAHV